ncbi:MAG: bifunctional folylpolyglutamate synthase/dihydrofolate synthase [Clostridia bacterium]|nr:bifunctional folylpolyglutamate synthase/dihydrofolate synthase [Clostridia bacterium]
MTFEETMAYIHATERQGSRPGLSRIRELCHALGDPQKKLRCIHVAGTNGKGSTSAMLAAVLRASGYRTALFTSPYVYRFGERMQIGGVPIPDKALCRIMDKVRQNADAMADKPTEFELITAAAFLWFFEEGVDVAVIEVGLGGRLDATNVIEDPLLSVVTGISLDHTAILGDTVEAIAREKAGILKPGAPVVVGDVAPAVREVLTEEAAAKGCPVTFLDAGAITVREVTPHGTRFSFGALEDVSIPFAAVYQPKNAALVLLAVEALRGAGLELPERAVRHGLANVFWPARFEYFRHAPDVVFDGSHNPEGIAAAAESIRRLYRGKVLLLTGVMRDKDYQAMIETLAPLCERVLCVRPDNPRALPAEELAAAWQAGGCEATAYPDVLSAMEAALAAARAERLPLFILGSLYLYREALDAFVEADGR